MNSTDIFWSSYDGSMALKSLFVNMMDDILGWKEKAVEFTDCTTFKCFFIAELELPSPAKPFVVVLMTSQPSLPPAPSLRDLRSGQQSSSLN